MLAQDPPAKVEEPSEGANGGSSSSRAPPPPSPGRSSSGGINGKEHRRPTHPEAMTFPEEWEGEAAEVSTHGLRIGGGTECAKAKLTPHQIALASRANSASWLEWYDQNCLARMLELSRRLGC